MIHAPPDCSVDLPLSFVTLEERPDLKDAVVALDNEVWPTFITRTTIHQQLLPHITEGNLARFQVLALLCPGTSREYLIGAVRSIPLMGVSANTLHASLPSAMLILAIRRSMALAEAQRDIEDWRTLTTINCVLSVAVSGQFRSSGVATELLRQLKAISRNTGFTTLVAPVRPTHRSLYPLHGFDEYCNWRDAEQQPFDPWVRAHTALGATKIQSAPHAVALYAGLEEWQTWTGMTFPESGDYWIPGGLSPLKVDITRQSGAYSEPRLWMAHTLPTLPTKLRENIVRTGTYRCTASGFPHPPSVLESLLLHPRRI